MESYFIKNLQNYFRSNGYATIETNNQQLYSYLINNEGNMYVINILNSKIYKTKHWNIAINSYEKAIDKFFKDVPVGKRFVLNVFIGDHNINELYDEVGQRVIEYDMQTMSINWFVDITNKELIIPKEYPDKILNIEKEIKRLFNPSENVVKQKEKYKLEYKSSKTTITYILILINLVVWITMTIAGGSTDSDVLIKFGAMETNKIIINHQYFRLFTSMFIHIGFSHLMYNMLSLYIFGSRIERFLGIKNFIDIYIISGIMGSLSSLMASAVMGKVIIAAGASSAIFGIEGAAFALALKSEKNIGQLSAYTIFIIMATGLLMGYVMPNVDNYAHVGGLVTGFLLTLKVIYQKK